MDPRYPTLPFSHSQPQQTPQDLRYGPIPPSPFASQPSQRSDTLHKNDPFLRRRNDLDERRRSPSLTNAPRNYILPHASQYPSTSIPTTQDAMTSDTQLRRSSFTTAGLWGDARGDRLALHTTEGMRTISSTFGSRKSCYGVRKIRSVLSLRFAAAAATVLFFALRPRHCEPRIAASQAGLSSDFRLRISYSQPVAPAELQVFSQLHCDHMGYSKVRANDDVYICATAQAREYCASTVVEDMSSGVLVSV